MTSAISSAVFVIASILAASWLIAVVEYIGYLLLQPWAFRLGPLAATIQEDADCPTGLMNVFTGKTERLKYNVLEDRRCIFRRKHALFEVRWNTPFEVKGTIFWTEGRLTVTGRYPLGVTVFFYAFMVSWTAGFLGAAIYGPTAGSIALACGWLFAGAMMLHSRRLELKRFRQYAVEIQSALR